MPVPVLTHLPSQIGAAPVLPQHAAAVAKPLPRALPKPQPLLKAVTQAARVITHKAVAKVQKAPKKVVAPAAPVHTEVSAPVAAAPAAVHTKEPVAKPAPTALPKKVPALNALHKTPEVHAVAEAKKAATPAATPAAVHAEEPVINPAPPALPKKVPALSASRKAPEVHSAAAPASAPAAAPLKEKVTTTKAVTTEAKHEAPKVAKELPTTKKAVVPALHTASASATTLQPKDHVAIRAPRMPHLGHLFAKAEAAPPVQWLLRVCNAFASAGGIAIHHLRAGKDQLLTDAALPYKRCADVDVQNFGPGSELFFELQTGSTTFANLGKYVVTEDKLPKTADTIGSLVQIVVRPGDKSQKAEFLAHVFAGSANGKGPEIAVVDASYGHSIPSLQFRPRGKEDMDDIQDVVFGTIAQLKPDEYEWSLTSNKQWAGESISMWADKGQRYVVLRVGGAKIDGHEYPEELVVFPGSATATMMVPRSRVALWLWMLGAVACGAGAMAYHQKTAGESPELPSA